MIDLSFSFCAPCWRWQSTATAWYFITLPEEQSEEIKFFSGHYSVRRGWGAVRVQARFGETTCQTSIFPYSKVSAYILPVKEEMRKKEKIFVENVVKVQLQVDM